MCDMVRTSECLSDGEVSDGSDVEEPAPERLYLPRARSADIQASLLLVKSEMFGQE